MIGPTSSSGFAPHHLTLYIFFFFASTRDYFKVSWLLSIWVRFGFIRFPPYQPHQPVLSLFYFSRIAAEQNFLRPVIIIKIKQATILLISLISPPLEIRLLITSSTCKSGDTRSFPTTIPPWLPHHTCRPRRTAPMMCTIGQEVSPNYVSTKRWSKATMGSDQVHSCTN